MLLLDEDRQERQRGRDSGQCQDEIGRAHVRDQARQGLPTQGRGQLPAAHAHQPSRTRYQHALLQGLSAAVRLLARLRASSSTA